VSDKSKKKIVVALPSLARGGTETHLLNVLPKLSKDSFEAELFVIHRGGELEQAFADAGIKIIGPAVHGSKMMRRVAAFALLLKKAWFGSTNIFHFFLPEAYIIGGLATFFGKNKRRILSRRSLNNYQKERFSARLFEPLLHRRMNALIGNSQAVVDQLEKEVGSKKPLRLLYNGIPIPPDLSENAKVRAKKTLGETPDTLLFVIVANLIPYKGHADLLKSLAGIKEQLPENWRLYCVGKDSGIQSNLEALAHSLDIADQIVWTGEQSDVARYWRAADIGVLCSLEEGFSNSLLEGMSFGVPMVVTKVGGNPEAVDDGTTGFIVPPSDPASLGVKLQRLAADADLRSTIGRAARLMVKQRFGLELCIKNYEVIYENVLDKSPA